MAEKKNPQILENYEIGDLIGKGRFAEVFRAVKRDLGREVALKILLPAWNENVAVRSQFMEQAKLIARLKHPHIVEALDLGEENGRLFMAMEYLPKGDLHEWLQSFEKKRPSLLQVVILVEDIAKALDFIHSQNASGGTLVHGDVKPGNILLIEERDMPGRLRAKLSDLGLLTVLQKAASMSGSSAFPQSSPLYISPEQADDNSPTPYSDQYALGVVTYELLSGQPTFIGGSDVTIYRHHKQTQPQPPSAHVSQLQREIDDVLLKVLAKDPSMRYPNCASFARALRQAVEVAEQKRFAGLLTQAREALAEGQPEKALPSLEEASQIKPDDREVKDLFEQAQKTALATRNYQEAEDLLETARTEAQKLRSEAPNYLDTQKLLATFAPRPPVWWEVLLNQWKRSLWIAGILLLVILFNIVAQAKPMVTTAVNTPVFQTMVGNFWTASPTHTPTKTLTPSPTSTLTSTPTLTPTFTPSPRPIATDSAAEIILMHRVTGLENAGWARSVAFSPDDTMLAVGMDGGFIQLWDIESQQPIGEAWTGLGNYVFSVAFSPDGTMLAAAADTTIHIWDIKSHKSIGEPLIGHKDYVRSIAFSPGGTILASGGSDRTIWLWDVKSGQPIGEPMTGHTDAVFSVTFSPNGSTLASGSGDKTIRLWDVENHQPIGVPLAGHSEYIWSVAFSPNGKILASGSRDSTIRLWDVDSQQPLGELLKVNSGTIYSVAFSPDGKMLASGSSDGQTHLWFVESRQTLSQPLRGGGSVFSVVFSQDGLWLASSSYAEAFLWSVPRWNTLGTPTLSPTRTTTPTP